MADRQFIAEIYKLYYRELFIYIFRFIGSHEASEDILQDAFHNLIQYSQKHKIDKTGARAFLYKTVHNLCINYKKRQSSISFQPIDKAQNKYLKNNSANDLESRELEAEIYALIEKTDPVTRSIFIMKKELNMNIDEIAEYTGKSVRTIRRKLQKLLSYMHEKLKQSGFILLFLILKLSLIGLKVVL